ncbi:cytochrome ubiquinol oxidase subunit I [Novispirillum sp. DQ9]|uniref:cytochrome ubiquinol oxidase subunit I n=1 Tax=Novispirillum sp. DQ9 TaxID=3398612 RepID=UPI003C7C27F3
MPESVGALMGDAVFLARLQFAFTIAFHILFPAFTIGLAWWLVVLDALWIRTRRDVYAALHRRWTGIFAVSFGMGVVSGIVMSYQFGTNWSRFSDIAGPIMGPLLSYEVLTAFFLEAGFLGIMLFGRGRVPPCVHMGATVLVAVGTLISAFWILAANSWMHTPQGHAIVDGRFHPADWWAVIFNPSFPYRFVHMVLATFLTTAFAVGAAGALALLRRPGNEAGRLMVSMAMWMALVTAPAQILAGDLHGLNTFEHQPAKVAAMEGLFETRAGAPLVLFGIPDMEAAVTRYAVEVPKLGAFILTHDWDGEVRGLDAFPREDWPPVGVVFFSFRVMVALGMLMAAVALLALVLRPKGRLFRTRSFLRLLLACGPAGFVAILAGWVTTEVGRQPWLIYGLMRTSDGASPVSAGQVGTSLAVFVVVYTVVFGAGTYYVLRLMGQPVDVALPHAQPPQGRRPMRPLSAAEAPPEPPAGPSGGG